ncbi:MAG: YfhO family protein [Bryobacteraceae bacterium]|jgi:hypothetical protein
MTPASKAWWTERRVVALSSLVATWLFFIEYLPPLRRVHFIWDIDGFHYPLLNYAFKTLHAGRFPEWDSAIYCGVSFAGNIQAGLFYPFNWLLFAVNWPRGGMTFMSIQVLLAFHFWLGFLFTYLWLRDRGLRSLAAICGGASFAFSGFLLNEAQHLGATCGIIWILLALWGIDQASRSKSWHPLWKVVAASALCFLAGYSFTWTALCACALIYALAVRGRLWLAPATLAALVLSLLVSMVQVLPAAEAASMKLVWGRFGNGGLPSLRQYFTLVMPNYYGYQRGTPPGIDQPYLYLGLAALFAVGWLLWRRGLRAAVPALALVGGCHWIMLDPFGWIAALFRSLTPLDQMVREWNLLASIPLAAALLTGVALDDFLSRPAGRSRPWFRLTALVVALGWTLRQLLVWMGQGRALLAGEASFVEVAVGLVCFGLVLVALRAEARPRWGMALAGVLLLLVWSDAKVYGTNRRFDADQGSIDRIYRSDARTGGPGWAGMDIADYRRILAAPTFRVAENDNPTLKDVRHYGVTTPQGSDPMVPAQYIKELEGSATFTSERTFRFDPANPSIWDRLAIRYVMSVRDGPFYQALLASPHFRQTPTRSFNAVFEFLDAKPAYRWAAGKVEVTRWIPEHREFVLDSTSGGDFVLIEQFYPGWRAFLDGRPVPIRRYSKAFQQVSVPAGPHRLQFEYRARGLRLGALISLVSCLGLWLGMRLSAPQPVKSGSVPS